MTQSPSFEPYFTVLTDRKFLTARLTDATRAEFFAGGETLVDFMWRTIQLRLAPDFGPTAILEYGCGVGRLAIPLARRAARRGGTVTAVDRSAAMLDVARDEAARQGVTNIEFCTPDELSARHARFDFVSCYLVLQRMPPGQGLALVRRLLGQVAAGGIGVFHFPYRSRTSPLVSASRWVRERVPGSNALVNRWRGQSQPFVPTHTYPLDDVFAVFDEAGFPAAHLAFDSSADLCSVSLFVESPIDPKIRRRMDPAVAGPQPGLARAGEVESRGAMIDVERLIATTTIDRLNAAAEEYFAALPNWDHHLAKPFSSADEAPWLLAHLTVLLQELHLKPGLRVLEFGAGTGWLSRFLTQLGCRVTLLDVSPTALRIARALYERMPVVGDHPAPEFLTFDGTRIDLPDASVDRIACFHAFHHVPNPASAIAEFARILAPGGLAAFAEPGPTHSRAAQSQFEMRTYAVVENDVDVHELGRIAREHGFVDLRLAVFHGLPFEVSLDRFEDFLRGGDTCAEWVADARVFLRNVRSFVLVKAGVEPDDSRSIRGLACEIHARAAGPARAGEPLQFTVTATNTGSAVWLPRRAGVGGVSIGVHVFDADGALASSDVLSTALAAGDVAPGECATVQISIPPLTRGRHILEIDCVAADVGWFGQLGSRPARVDVEVR
jgi:ubiquinone/menaquinone biosynthesis C-methylase UbiE